MARTSIAERMSRLEQQRARLAEEEAKLKTDQRKERTRRLIKTGTLIERAGLIELEEAVLYGALLWLAGLSGDAARVAEWAEAGQAAFDRDAKADDATKEPLTISFPVTLPTAFSTRLRATGLRWNKLLQHWEGFVDHDKVAELVVEHGGSITRLPNLPNTAHRREVVRRTTGQLRERRVAGDV